MPKSIRSAERTGIRIMNTMDLPVIFVLEGLIIKVNVLMLIMERNIIIKYINISGTMMGGRIGMFFLLRISHVNPDKNYWLERDIGLNY